MRLKQFVIQFIIVFPLFSQNPTSNEIDSILKKSFQEFAAFQFNESAKHAKQALKLSTSDNYSKGKAMSNLYIAKVLIEVGLNSEALEYIHDIYTESFYKKDIIIQVEYHRLKGRIYGAQQLYALAKEAFNKQLSLSESIVDPKKRELSKLWAYQNIEHLYAMQGINDSIELYQKFQEEQLSYFEEHEVFYNISVLYVNRAKLYLNRGKFDDAAVQIQKSFDVLNKYNVPYKYYTLQTLGDLEAAKGNINKAISYYHEALENSTTHNATQTSRDLHKKLTVYMLENDTLRDKAIEHGRQYTILNDSLVNDNNQVMSAVLEQIIMDNKKYSAKQKMLFWYVVIGFIVILILSGTFLIVRNRRNKKKLILKSQQLISKTAKIELLEEKLDNNIFQDILALAKSNSPEFLPLFGEGYPEFIEAMKALDPNIRSSELYFSAYAYLNFSTKDIANYTFVTPRAVQMRKNRIRKKYGIDSEIDFNEWFRGLENRSTKGNGVTILNSTDRGVDEATVNGNHRDM